MKRKIHYLALFLILTLLMGCSIKQNNPNANNVTDKKIQEDKNKEESGEKINTDTQDNNDSNEEKIITNMSVNFLNYSFLVWSEEGATYTESYLHFPKELNLERYWRDYSQMASFYDVEEDSEELFAFIFYLGDYGDEQPEDYPVQQEDESDEDYIARKELYLDNKRLELIELMGLSRLENYPYSYDILYRNGQFAVYSPETESYQQPEGEGAPVVVGTIKQIKELCEHGGPINGWYCRFVSALRPDIAEYLNSKGYQAYWDGWTYWPNELAENLETDRQVILDVDVIE